jgi:hypothetical protein
MVGKEKGAAEAAPVMRIIRSNCDATNCTTQCNDDEILLMAYSGSARMQPFFRPSVLHRVVIAAPRTIRSS